MTQAPWWASAVVYQIYPRSFADADGDGIGDVPGIISKLDYLHELGVDVVWISPFYRSPMDDNGYDISDYRDVDPVFGTLADLDKLIAQLHARGMKLVIDVVVNHTSDEHPWFVESRASKDNPKRDWYWWRPAHDGREPTNWIAAFQGSAWELDPTTDEYYLHLFSRRQPDLNWENPDVRAAVYEMLRWWLARGVDGFRMDVINYVSKRLPLQDGPPIPNSRYGNGSAFYWCGPRIHEFLHELNTEVIASQDRQLVTVGEMPGVTIEDAQRFTDPANAEVDMVFQFEHVGLDHGPGGRYDLAPLRLTDLKRSLGRWQEGLAKSGWNSLYWNNHDQPRAVSRYGTDDPEYRVRSAKLLGTVLHLHRGTPYVYQGEELGMTNYPFASIDELRDLDSLNYYAAATAAGRDADAVFAALRTRSRDNGRTPMQWDASEHAGFTTGTPWIAVNPNHVEINAAAQADDPDSVFRHYQKLIALRHELPVVAHGEFSMLLPDDEHVYAFTRRDQGVELLVIANFGEAEQGVDLPDWSGAELVLGNYPDPGAELTLRAWEARVLISTPGGPMR
ncbi:MAG: alpha-glucosidase [Actinomycetota bacterium]|nr:alpha-glucosidase [Actinomycetota bacterium]